MVLLCERAISASKQSVNPFKMSKPSLAYLWNFLFKHHYLCKADIMIALITNSLIEYVFMMHWHHCLTSCFVHISISYFLRLVGRE